MFRSSLAVVALLLSVTPCVAASPTPAANASPRTVRQAGGFSTTIRRPAGTTAVSGAACNRRSPGANGSQGTLGPNGASTSQTLISVPIGGGNVASATQQHQISEACAHQRR
jgi:hypothetical protein